MPIIIHIVTDENGNYEANEEDLINEINLSNSYLESVNINIELCDFNYISNSELFHFKKANGYSLLASFNEPDVINMYIVQTLTNLSGNSSCGFAFYPWSSFDLAVVKNSCATNGSTMAHEIGHYFGLYHTHESSFGDEFVNKSNCDVAGDLICDTNADPRLSSSNVNSSCEYIGLELDVLGALYKPDTDVVMSYSLKSCRNKFTPEQGIVMRNVCDEFYPTYLCKGGVLSSKNKLSNLGFTAYPNPPSDILNLKVFGMLEFRGNLYDLNGKQVKSIDNQTYISTKDLSRGIYFLEIIDYKSGSKFIEKIMIQR